MSVVSSIPVKPGPHISSSASPDLPILQELAARHLESSGRFRILRRIPERARIGLEDARRIGCRIGAIVDVETTGLDPHLDEIVEFGAVSFAFDGGGKVYGIVETITEFQEPLRPLRPEITTLTGISEDMLHGRSIDRDRVNRFLAPAEFVVAHNASFDRLFCEKLSEAFRTLPWACSLRDVEWDGLGRGGLKLGQLLAGLGLFHTGHRALDDCLATLEIIASAYGRAVPPLIDISRAVAEARIEIRAERAPYEAKETLKARGYRWHDGADGRPKCWSKEVAEKDFDAETGFLRAQVYRGPHEPIWRRLDATSRYR